MACRSSFSSCKENHPDPKSGWDLDPDKPVCVTSCHGGLTDPAFLHAFSCFSSLIPRLRSSHKVGYRVGSSGTPR